MSISANTLFHFTLKDKLKNILSKGFHASYSLEDISVVAPFESSLEKIYIPMVCFCDLPFHQILQHMDFYGHYGIGLKKESWGATKGISPVHYIPEASLSSLTINSIATEIHDNKSLLDDFDFTSKLYDVYKLIKPFKGKMVKRKEGIPFKSRRKFTKIFYDEREWRYCPRNFGIIPFNKQNTLNFNKANQKLKQKKEQLIFKPEDVKYIIVKTEREIMEFAKLINRNPRFKKKSKLLISKLISVEQIKADF